MDDAYTIGITLALENGVSDGLAIIRRDLQALDLAIAHTVGGLAEMRRAGDAAIAGVGLDLARLAAEGQRLLENLPSVTAPAPLRRSLEAVNRVEEAAIPPGEAAAPAAPTIAIADAPPLERLPFDVAASPQRSAVPPASVAPLVATHLVGISAPATPAASPAVSESAPHLAPVARETPSRVPVDLQAMSAAPVVPPSAPHLAPVARETPSRVLADLATVNAAPVIPSSAPMRVASIAPIVPIPLSVSPSASVGPIPGWPVAALAPGAAAPIALRVAGLSALARGAVPDMAPTRSAPARLAALGVSAAPKSVVGPIQPATAFSRAEFQEQASSSRLGSRTSHQPAGTAGSTVPVKSIVPPGVPNWEYRSEPIAAAESMPGPGREPEQHRQTGFRAEGPVYLDSQMVGRWICEHLAREAGRAPAGPTGFDPRAGMIWPGAPIQT